MTLAGFVVLKIPFAPRRFLRLSRRIAAGGGGKAEKEGCSDLIAHLTWFPVNEKLVADGHERTVSRLSLESYEKRSYERKRWFNSNRSNIHFRDFT